MRLTTVLFVCLGLLPSPAVAQSAFVLDTDGRTLRAASHVSSLRTFRIDIPAPNEVELCDKKHRPGALLLRIDERDEVVDPYVIGTGKPAPHDGKGFAVRPRKPGFLVYNILRQAVADPASLDGCRDSINVQSDLKAELESKVEIAEREAASAETLVTRLTERLKSQQQDAASYAGIPGSGPDVARALQAVEATRTDLKAALTDLDSRRENLRIARDTLKGFPAAAKRELKASLEEATYLYKMLTGGAVVKVGAVFVGDNREGIFYDFSARDSESTLQLEPLGEYPTLTHDERVFVVIANVDTARHTYPFRLSASVSAGSAVNTEPVRPTFEVLGEGAGLTAATAPVDAHAFRDVVLRLRDGVPPNGIAEVTIVTEQQTAADPDKLETVTLVDKAKFPQFRARYRYNFATGVFRSRLRDVTFSKVRTQDDDPATEEVDESLYRIDRHVGDPTIKPGFALSYYLFPVDQQSRIGWRELVPAPTLGFAFQNPQDNIYAGFTFEPLRHAQIFLGWHFGLVNEIVPRNDISEEKDGTPVATRQRRLSKGEFTWGVTFNIAVIGKIFK